MQLQIWIFVLLTTAVAHGAESSEPSKVTAQETNQAIVRALVRGFNAMDLSVVDKYVARNLIQHDPTVGDGREAFRAHLRKEFAAAAGQGGPQIQILQLGADGPFVYLHTKRFNRAGNALSVMHVFRMDAGKLAEQWKIIAELTPQMAASAKNPHPLF